MFEHVILLLSFVFAIALTHLLSSATELLLERDRVRISGLHVLWMANALLALLVNWLSFWGLIALKHWTVSEIELQFVAAIVQYFTCSTLSIRPPAEGPIDMPALYERHRKVIFGAFMALMLIAMFQNYWDRNNTEGMAATDWIREDLAVLPMAIAVAIAGWARPIWLQWAAGLAMLGLELAFLTVYAVPA